MVTTTAAVIMAIIAIKVSRHSSPEARPSTGPPQPVPPGSTSMPPSFTVSAAAPVSTRTVPSMGRKIRAVALNSCLMSFANI